MVGSFLVPMTPMVSDTRKFDRGLTTLLHNELHWLDVPERVTLSWLSWCTVVFTVWHLGTSLTNSLQPLTSLHGFVCVPQTDISLLYFAVDSTHTAVGRLRLPVPRSGIRCRASWEIQCVVLTVLNSFSRQSLLVSSRNTMYGLSHFAQTCPARPEPPLWNTRIVRSHPATALRP